MNPLLFQTLAQISVGHVLNALPVGLLIAFFAWALLRLVKKQNSGTRFAVWFMALLAVVALPLLGAFEDQHAIAMVSAISSIIPSGHMRPALWIPGQWAVIIFLLWAAGAFVAMVRLVTGLWHLRELRRSCIPIMRANLDPLVRGSVDMITMSGSITVATSDQVRVPAAIGFWKRTIVLPTWAVEELPAADLNAILLHELAHLQRGDEWTNLIQKIVRSLFFFHPAVWWIEKQLSVEREMACDDAVLEQTANPRGYASCLISLLEKSLAHRGWSMAQSAVHRAHEASMRLAQILDGNRPSATRIWKPALGMIATFSVVCIAGSLQAPQLVAFDSGPRASFAAAVYAAVDSKPGAPTLSLAISQPPKRTMAAVVPAALRTAATPNARVAKPVTAHAGIKHESAADVRVVAAKSNNEEPAVGATLVGLNEDAQLVPQYQTVVFLRATQYGAPNSAVWSVEVWRVTFVNAVLERNANVPVANSI